MAGNDSLDTDSGNLVEVEMDIDEDVLIASDLSCLPKPSDQTSSTELIRLPVVYRT